MYLIEYMNYLLGYYQMLKDNLYLWKVKFAQIKAHH